jgi:hypothetical protein
MIQKRKREIKDAHKPIMFALRVYVREKREETERREGRQKEE